ncbi:unnamed protein product, partial [Amoebophrya sp. A120]
REAGAPCFPRRYAGRKNSNPHRSVVLTSLGLSAYRSQKKSFHFETRSHTLPLP